MMNLKTFVFNPLQENTFVIWDETMECVIVDAGCFNKSEFDVLDNFIADNGLKPVKLINTHCHFDHIFGIQLCRKAYHVMWEAHSGDNFLVTGAKAKGAMFGLDIEPIALPELALDDNSEVSFGNTRLQVLHVPGHSPGSVCFYNQQAGVVIVGDVLFKGSIGRTDLDQGDFDSLINGIKSKLLTLPGETLVYPGHGPSTSIAHEKATNPFLQ